MNNLARKGIRVFDSVNDIPQKTPFISVGEKEIYLNYYFDKLESDIPGLKYIPSVIGRNILPGSIVHSDRPTDRIPNSEDELEWNHMIDLFWEVGKNHITFTGLGVMKEHTGFVGHEVRKLNKRKKDKKRVIVEFGVDADSIKCGINHNYINFTKILTGYKDDDVIYVGIDIVPKDYLCNNEKNIYTICEDTLNQDKIRVLLSSWGVDTVDIMLVDASHSIISVCNDFKYTDLLSDDGVCFFHDINTHTGPNLVFSAIDEKIFEKTNFFEGCANEGIGCIRKIHKGNK